MKKIKNIEIVEISDVEKLFEELTSWDKMEFLAKQLKNPLYYNEFVLKAEEDS